MRSPFRAGPRPTPRTSPSAPRPGGFPPRPNVALDAPIPPPEEPRHDLSPAFAALGLRPSSLNILAAMNISEPTPIQAKAIPVFMAGRDVIGQARTGSGKTLAFALPLVERCDPRSRAVQALILVPTRELAIQVADVMQPLAARMGLRLTLLYGGHGMGLERQALAGGAQIVVGTPGRTLDHLRQNILHLENLKIFVLDEADEMLDRGFAPDVERIIGHAPRERQTALFSATMPEWVATTASKHLIDPVTVEVDAGEESPPEIEHVVYEMDLGDKIEVLKTLLDRREDGPILVFGRTKHGVKRLAQQLGQIGYPAAALQGNLSQNARERVMADFRSGRMPILLATNVAARGLDVDGISQVINFELPESPELFTHRVGRTGRMGRRGEAITFVTPEDSAKLRQIERALGRKLPRQQAPGITERVMTSRSETPLDPAAPRRAPQGPAPRRRGFASRPGLLPARSGLDRAPRGGRP